MTPSNKENVQIAVMQNDITYIKDKLKSIDEKVGSSYVTKSEHSNTVRRVKLLEKIVYGAVSVILLAVVAAVVNLVVNK